MKLAKLTPALSVSAQLTEQDLEAAAAAGFKSVINNRPDGESPDQPRNEDLAAAAERLGLEYRYLPLVPGQLSDDLIAAFGSAVADMKGPTLAFCRSGTRSTTLWALASARNLAPSAIIETAAAAGYDLEGLRPKLEDLASGK